jgi:hypothetical protein
VHGHELQVGLRGQDVLTRLGQLGAHGQRDGPVEEEQDQCGADGQDSDPLVVGA